VGVGFAPVRRPKVGLVVPDVVPFERERHHGEVGPPIRCAQAGEIDVGEKAAVVSGLVSAASSLALPGLDPAAAIVAALGATLSVSWKRPLVALLILILVLDTGFALPLLVGVGARCRCAQGEHRHTIRFEEGRGSRPGCSEQRRLGAGSARAFIERIESFEHPQRFRRAPRIAEFLCRDPPRVYVLFRKPH